MAFQKTDTRACTKVIPQLIKDGEVKRVYLLYGEENYLVQQNKNNLMNFLAENLDDMNVSRYQGTDIDEQQFMDMAETLPFFADRRVMLVEGCGWFANGNDKIATYLAEASESTVFVFVEQKVDGRNKLTKLVKDIGVAVDYVYQDEDTLNTWIRQRAGKEGLNMSPAVARLLINKIGTQMQRLHTELEKVIAYAWGKNEITAQDVDAVCVDTIEDRIFDMVEAVSLKNQKKVLSLYKDLLALKEPPVKIMVILNNEYARLLTIKALADKGMNDSAIANTMGIKQFVVTKRMPIVRKYRLEELRDCLNKGIQADQSYKEGKMQDRVAVEVLLVELTQVTAQKRD